MTARTVVALRVAAAARTHAGGALFSTGGCLNPSGVDRPEALLDAGADRGGVARLDGTNPVTGDPWSIQEIAATEAGIRHPADNQQMFVPQLIYSVGSTSG